MSHKEKMKLPKKEVKIRKTWGNLNPITKVIATEKKYNRNKEKRSFRKETHECDW